MAKGNGFDQERAEQAASARASLGFDRDAVRLEPLLGGLLVALAALTSWTWLRAAAARLAFPFEIEWLESGVLQQVVRVLAGQPLYAAPSAEFAATIHPPLYAWTSAAMARLLGAGFLAPRLVSVLATLGSALLIGRAAAAIGKSTRGGVVAAALFVAAYVPCGTIHDLARLDPLWVFLLLAATALAAAAADVPTPARVRPLLLAAGSGLLIALAAATKQPAALFAPLLAAALFWSRRPAAFAFAGACGSAVAALYGGLHVATGGWSTAYLVTIPLRVPHHASALLHLVRDDLLGNFAPAIVLLLLWLAVPRGERPLGPFPPVWTAAALAAFLATLSMRTIQGGGENTLLPLVAFAAVLVGAVLGRALRAPVAPARILALVALIVQFARLVYSPAAIAPNAGERRDAEAFVALLRALAGPVWVPSHVSYPWLAGKPLLAGRDPLLDLLYSGHDAFPADLERALATGAYAAVVLDGPFPEPRLAAALAAGYGEPEAVPDPPATRVMYATAPRLLYRPRSAGAGVGAEAPAGTMKPAVP